MNISCVNDKISGVFVCQTRPLKEGEAPKHPGATDVYEATNVLQPDFKEALDSKTAMQCSWKIDGTCCMIENGIYYRRRDIRKGSKIPEGAVLGEVDSTGHANIAWLPLNASKDPEDKHHLSALEVIDGSTYFWTIDATGDKKTVPLSSIQKRATFELIGPMVQSNLYDIPSIPVPVMLKKGVANVPRHYLVPHGTFVVSFPMEIFSQPEPLEFVKRFIIENRAEGLVFRCGDRYFKVNRGHVGEKVEGKLLLAGLVAST